MIYLVEPSVTGGVGAMGMKLLHAALNRAGFVAAHIRIDRAAADQQMLFATDTTTPEPSSLPPPDAWYVSCLYPRQWVHLPAMFRAIGLAPLARDRSPGDPLVAIGGQMAIAPEPVADFADILALGDGEVTGVDLARRLSAGGGRMAAMDWAMGRLGYYVPLYQSPPTPFIRVESEGLLPQAVIHGGLDRRITIEVARGCRSKCAFCPIGWAGGRYREWQREAIGDVIRANAGRAINLYAPDYSSISYVLDLDAALDHYGCHQTGRDARIDATLRHIQAGGHVRSYNFGIEGTSERLRSALGKPLTHGTIVDTMRLLDGPAREVKFYIIVGLPGETVDDRAEFERLLLDLRSVYRRSRLVISPTHLQSVPHTPLQWCDNRYDADAEAWVWRMREKLAAEDKGDGRTRWMITPVKGEELHSHDAYLQRGGRWLSQYILALDARESMIQSGSWRKLLLPHMPTVEQALQAIAEGTCTPWSHVEVGVSRSLVAHHWQSYRRKVGLEARASNDAA